MSTQPTAEVVCAQGCRHGTHVVPAWRVALPVTVAAALVEQGKASALELKIYGGGDAKAFAAPVKALKAAQKKALEDAAAAAQAAEQAEAEAKAAEEAAAAEAAQETPEEPAAEPDEKE